MLGEIIENVVSAQPDMEVVGNLDGRTSLTEAAANLGVDVVIVELVTSHPQIKVLAVAGDGRGAFLYELRPQTSSLGEVSPQGLVDAIRAATAAPLHP